MTNVNEEEDFEWNCEELFHKFHTKHLVERLRGNFDGPIYRDGEDLEAVRNSDSPFVAVIAPDQPMAFFVSREAFLQGDIELNAADLFAHSGMPCPEVYFEGNVNLLDE